MLEAGNFVGFGSRRDLVHCVSGACQRPAGRTVLGALTGVVLLAGNLPGVDKGGCASQGTGRDGRTARHPRTTEGCLRVLVWYHRHYM